jgi:hypothetical protein
VGPGHLLPHSREETLRVEETCDPENLKIEKVVKLQNLIGTQLKVKSWTQLQTKNFFFSSVQIKTQHNFKHREIFLKTTFRIFFLIFI